MIVANQMLHFLKIKNLLSRCQHGFRSRISTEMALTVINDTIINNMDHKKMFLLTLYDLSKAFDSVSHDILISKCDKVKINSFWINSYVSNRTQSARLNDIASSNLSITYGVPQGSILDPILISIYVNDMSLPKYDCVCVQYADEIKFLHTGTVSNLENLIVKTEETLTKANHYFLRNGLMINPNKFNPVYFYWQ